MMFTDDLFGGSAPVETIEQYGEATFIFRGFVCKHERQLIQLIKGVEAQAAFRHMVTPNGFEMSVAMTNCGDLGWISGLHEEYHYGALDPENQQPWPSMPDLFYSLAVEAAAKAGFKGFAPDSCIINRYAPEAKLGLHQDSDEREFLQPVVSVSLGLPATFLLGGNHRDDPVERVTLLHGDVVVWGGPDRMRYHGIAPIKDGNHPLTGHLRYNLSIRVAG
jgi:alkylated DNA repair protein (DNA oxidative demethylase)